jgi:hypothetical protein
MRASDRRRAWVLAAALALTLGCPGRDAFAQGAKTGEADPHVPFDEGRALIRDGRYAEALKKFEQSAAIVETPGALLNIGDCEVKLGRYASAVVAFGRAAELASAAGQPERTTEAHDREASVRPLVSTLAVRVDGAVDGIAITVDGRAAANGTPANIDGGEHVVHVSAPCRLDVELRVTVGIRSDARTVKVTLPEDPACGPPRPHVEAPADAAAPRPFPTLAVVSGAVGVVALGLGVGFGLDAAGKKSDLESACTSYPSGCPAARRSELDATANAADRSATISTIGFAAGVAFVATGVVLYLVGRPATKTASTPFHVVF